VIAPLQIYSRDFDADFLKLPDAIQARIQSAIDHLGLRLSVWGLVVGLGVDAVTHGWADRRSTLAWLAKVTGKTEFYSLGTGTHPAHPVTAMGKPAAHLGTGAYALDQSFHHLWLLVAALLITLV